MGIYNCMNIVITESQYKRLTSEARKPKEIQGCSVFSDMNLRDFCKVAESEISSNLNEYKEPMEKLLKTYFNSNEKISKLVMEILDETNPIVSEGFNQIDEVIEKIKKNCPTASVVAKKLKDKWISEYNVYYKTSDGEYHLLNRLNTNYTAMAVLVTVYYEDLIHQVREWTRKKDTKSSSFAKNWVDHFFNPKSTLIDPRPNVEKNFYGLAKKLIEPKNRMEVLNQVLEPEEFVFDESNTQKGVMLALEEVRNKGFKTENIFEEKLKKYNITYEKYNYDYSFVDMVLGIDFLIKQSRDGDDYWIPVQVKSSFKEFYNLVDKFKCTKVIKPELEKIDGKEDFKIGDIRGFEEYFCKEHEYCKTTSKKETEKKKVYTSPSSDYFGSREYIEKNS